MDTNTGRISPLMLRQIHFFQALEDDELEAVMRHTREVAVTKGQILFNRGDSAQGFYFVMTGQIKLAVSTPQGNEKVVEIIHPMQTFGEAVMFLDRNYPVFAEAVVASRLLHVSHRIVSELIDTSPAFSRKMLAGMAIRLHGLVQDVERYSLQSSMQRVIGYLLQLPGRDDVSGPVEIELPSSKQMIASRLNLTPETLSRIFNDLTHAELIVVHGRSVTLTDPAGLARYQG